MNNNYELEVYESLKELGIPPSLSGYRYISSIVTKYLTGECNLTNKFMYVYTKTAKEFNVTTSRVERAIRHSVQVCFMNADTDTLYKYFGGTISQSSGKLCNHAFIMSVVEYIRVHIKKEL